MTRRGKIWTVALTAVATLVVVLLSFNFMGSTHSVDRELAHVYAIDDIQFRREMGVLLGPSITSGNRVEPLDNGREIFPAMLADIRAAQRTITFETYIYWSGEIGREFSEALAERARAGVDVHVVIDWVGGMKMEDELGTLMEDAGVDLHIYRPLHWYNISRMNKRTHRKLLVVDGRIGYTGGVGIADVWGGDAEDPDHWRDMHFRVTGPVVAQLQAAFNDNWIKTTGTLLSGPDYFPQLEPVGEMDAHLFIASPAGGSESMHLMYLSAIAAADHSIDLTASYFVPDELIMKALVAARKRGVRVRVLLPGQHIDSETVRLSSKASWGGLLDEGIEIHEYQPTMLHVKLLIVDGELVSLGSTNFDIRSFRLNDEASLNVYDRTFAARMTEVFEQDLVHAIQYSHEMWEQRPLHEKLAEKVVRPIRSQL